MSFVWWGEEWQEECSQSLEDLELPLALIYPLEEHHFHGLPGIYLVVSFYPMCCVHCRGRLSTEQNREWERQIDIVEFGVD